jgi:DNA-binding response OmpR family regulator
MSGRLLIVEDDAAIADVLSQYLGALGFQVHMATDKEEAEALLDNFSYELVVTDIGLSRAGTEGLELLGKICDSPAPPRIIVLSGKSAPEVRDAAEHRGIDLFLNKPVPLATIGSAVKNLLGDSHVLVN